MQLLLTSAGLTNASLREAFIELLPRPCQLIKVAFIPTAANVSDDQSWVQKHIDRLREMGVAAIDVVDIANLSGQESTDRCAAADVLWFNGGNTYFLLDWVRRSGLAAQLPTLLEDRLYVGVSAGSMIAGPTIETNTPFFPEEGDHRIEDLTGLDLVRFAVVPHMLSADFPHCSPPMLEQFAGTVTYPIYAMDNASAVVVIDGSIRVISEGEVRVYNNQENVEKLAVYGRRGGEAA